MTATHVAKEAPIITSELTRSDVERIVSSAIERERAQTERALMEQEHRSAHVLRNVITTWHRGAEHRSAALKAFFWWLMPARRTAVTFGVTLIGVAGIFLAIRANIVLEEQNLLLDTQNHLIEGQRRSTLIFEITSIFEGIEREKRDASWKGNDAKFVPSASTTARIVSLTRALRPYHPLNLDYENEGFFEGRTSGGWFYEVARVIKYVRTGLSIDPPTQRSKKVRKQAVSPERAQILIYLITSGVALQHINAAGADFSFSDLTGLRINNVDLSGIDLSRADLRNVILTHVDLRDAVLHRSNLDRTEFLDVDLRGTNLSGSQVDDAEFNAWFDEKTNFASAHISSITLDPIDGFLPSLDDVSRPGFVRAKNQDFVIRLYEHWRKKFGVCFEKEGDSTAMFRC